MKLRYAPTSPYVRKCLVVARERGLLDRIEIVPTNPWTPDSTIAADNPLGKIPALATDDGLVLFDSRVICEYLDSLGDAPPLFPAPPARWRALRSAAIGEGILDAADVRIMESRRPAGTIDAAWDARKRGAIERALDVLEREAADLARPLDIGHVTVGCALGEMDFRFPAEDWRASRPALAHWYAGFAARPAMAATVTIHWDEWEKRRAAG